MANNRMYLKYNPTGEKVLLAKRMGWGWYVFHDDLVKKLDELFNKSKSGDGHHDDYSLELEISVADNTPMKI